MIRIDNQNKKFKFMILDDNEKSIFEKNVVKEWYDKKRMKENNIE